MKVAKPLTSARRPAAGAGADFCSNKTTCPITRTAELLSDTWTILIMRALTEGPKRFNELDRWLEGISTRTLTRKLETLKKEGMLVRSSAGIYTLTDKGKGIRIIEKAMIRYSEQYLK